jgi:hypothetical protein
MANSTFLDHITVTAPSLAAGAAHIAHSLGVQPQTGGEHPRMGTHNLLLRLGDALFLEVIAVNPAATAPARPRWFALDDITPDSPPRLATWVVRSQNIHASAQSACADLGAIESMTRGTLNWLITIPEDGTVPMQGVAPALIEWQTDVHAASRLEDKGLSLAGLEIHHPQAAQVNTLLASLALDALVTVKQSSNAAGAYLCAYINTPTGIRCLR